MAKIYVASSWRNEMQPIVVSILRDMGHEVYDFKHPREGDNGFHWSDVMPNYMKGPENQLAYTEEYMVALHHPIAEAGFHSDFDAMQWADACLLVLPCGRSAHLEMGWMVGQGKKSAILLDDDGHGRVTPELMYKMVDAILPGLASMSNWARALG